MSESQPLVSVIIPTYNQASLLVKTVASVLRQSYPNYEIVIADDGSTDETAARVAAMKGPIHYLGLPRTGRNAVPRNRALNASSGSLIAFLDHDDLWHEDKLAYQVDAMAKEPGLGLVYCDAWLLYPDGSLSAPVLLPHQKSAVVDFTRLLESCFVHPSTAMVRRQVLEEIGGFDERFESQNDYHLWLRVAHHSGMTCVAKPLVFVRRHPASYSAQRGILEYRCTIQIFEHLRETLSLTLRQRWFLRNTLARLNTHIGLYELDNHLSTAARRHFLRSLIWNPIQRRAWSALAESFSRKSHA